MHWSPWGALGAIGIRLGIAQVRTGGYRLTDTRFKVQFRFGGASLRGLAALPWSRVGSGDPVRTEGCGEVPGQ